jgi:uncharacterized protein (TIGR02266 family)
VRHGKGHVKVLLVGRFGRNLDLDRTALRRSEVELIPSSATPDTLNLAQREPIDLVVIDAARDAAECVYLCLNLKTLPVTDDIPVVMVIRPSQREDVERARPDLIVERPLTTADLLTIVRRFTMVQERRHDRYPINLRFTFESEDFRGQAFSRVLSAGGAFLKTDRPMPVGTRLRVVFRLPGDQREIRCKAVVRNTRLDDPAEQNPGFGIEFEELGNGDQYRLTCFIDSLTRRVSGL